MRIPTLAQLAALRILQCSELSVGSAIGGLLPMSLIKTLLACESLSVFEVFLQQEQEVRKLFYNAHFMGLGKRNFCDNRECRREVRTTHACRRLVNTEARLFILNFCRACCYLNHHLKRTRMIFLTPAHHELAPAKRMRIERCFKYGFSQQDQTPPCYTDANRIHHQHYIECRDSTSAQLVCSPSPPVPWTISEAT